MNKISAKRQEFQAQIRRQNITERIGILRKSVEIELTTPEDLARQMKLPPR